MKYSFIPHVFSCTHDSRSTSPIVHGVLGGMTVSVRETYRWARSHVRRNMDSLSQCWYDIAAADMSRCAGTRCRRAQQGASFERRRFEQETS